MDLAAFRVRHPSFDRAGDALVQAVLDAAALELDAEIFDTNFDEAHGLLTAHKLSCAPEGKNARLSKETIDTVYSKQLEQISLACAAGPRVA